jgi:hypothetical protein
MQESVLRDMTDQFPFRTRKLINLALTAKNFEDMRELKKKDKYYL